MNSAYACWFQAQGSMNKVQVFLSGDVGLNWNSTSKGLCNEEKILLQR